jgi:hypothetical protein
MKPQSLRRSLWLGSGLLAASVAGTVGWYALKVRPAQGAPRREVDSWLDRHMQAYNREPIGPQIVHPVHDDELPAVTRPDLPKIGGKKVGVFVGPVPPEPQPDEEKPAVAAGPKGLAEVGKLIMVMYAPPRGTVITWEWANDPKRREQHSIGDVVAGRFQILEVTPVLETGSPVSKWRIAYEFEEVAGKPKKRAEEVFDLRPDPGAADKIKTIPAPVAAVDASAGTGTGGASAARPRTGEPAEAASVDPAAAPVAVAPPTEERPSAVRLHRLRAGTKTQFSFPSRASYDHYAKNLEQTLSQVKTEEAVGSDGRARGVRVTGGIGPGTIGEEFDIQAGDILLTVNGRPVHNRNDVATVLRGLPKDTASIQVVIERNARQIVYEVDPRDPDTRRGASRLGFE